MSDRSSPPFYILLAHSSLSGLPSALGHPIIQYHYADDSPLSLLPTHPDEHVLVFDHSINPTVHSISKRLSVIGLRLEEAPGAAVEGEASSRNATMYIVETTSNDQSMTASHGDRKSAHSILAQFRNRNAVLRKTLQYAPISSDNVQANTTSTNQYPNLT